ncbi:MAG TPA: hypothetical protein VFV73_44070 [Streptosporangiaceae bacterium]|nr:hypothetical protein [Streptosporangiaceae bacterium]
MSEPDKENNKKPGGLETVIALPAKYVMSAIGAVLSISGFVALVTAQSVKTWVKSHPYPIFLALIIAVLVVTGTLDYAYNMRKRIKVPSGHDKRLYGAALERLPVNGAVIGWLKHVALTDASDVSFPADVLDALEKTVEFFRTQPVGFDDAELAHSFKSLAEAITGFRRSVDSWTLAAHARQLKRMMTPPPGTSAPGDALSEISPALVSRPVAEAGLDEETTALTHRQRELVRAYDQFVRTAHARGIDTDG